MCLIAGICLFWGGGGVGLTVETFRFLYENFKKKKPDTSETNIRNFKDRQKKL
jgi:hypothetical protein